MELQFGNPVIFVKDIGISKHFYMNLLAQRIEMDFGCNVVFQSGLCLWELRSDLPITRHLRSEKMRTDAGNRFELYFETTDIISAFSRLSAENIRLLHPIHEEPWGQQTFRFFDPDSHLIEIGETIAAFVKRFQKQGMTPGEIHERTGVPRIMIDDILKPGRGRTSGNPG